MAAAAPPPGAIANGVQQPSSNDDSTGWPHAMTRGVAIGAHQWLVMRPAWPAAAHPLDFLDSPMPNDVLQVPGVLAGPTRLPFAPFPQNDRNGNDVREERFNSSCACGLPLQTPGFFTERRNMLFDLLLVAQSLAEIEFALRRYSRLHDGEEVPHALLVDWKFLLAMVGWQLES